MQHACRSRLQHVCSSSVQHTHRSSSSTYDGAVSTRMQVQFARHVREQVGKCVQETGGGHLPGAAGVLAQLVACGQEQVDQQILYRQFVPRLLTASLRYPCANPLHCTTLALIRFETHLQTICWETLCHAVHHSGCALRDQTICWGLLCHAVHHWLSSGVKCNSKPYAAGYSAMQCTILVCSARPYHILRDNLGKVAAVQQSLYSIRPGHLTMCFQDAARCWKAVQQHADSMRTPLHLLVYFMLGANHKPKMSEW